LRIERTIYHKFGGEPNLRPPGAVSPTATEETIWDVKFRFYRRHVANAIASAHTARAVFVLAGLTLAT